MFMGYLNFTATHLLLIAILYLSNIMLHFPLQERKVDKAFVKKELECKVDKSAIANKLNRDQFNACIEEIDRNIQAVIQKSEGTVGR